jgi:hypothetical protein
MKEIIMKKVLRILLLLCAGTMWTNSAVYAQCATSMLVALDGEQMTLNVSVRTMDPHCIAGGTIYYECIPLGAVFYERESESRWDWCFEIKATDEISRNPIVAVNMPPGMPFQLLARTVYTEPEIYPSQIKEEMVWVNPMSGFLETYHPTPCLDNVPSVVVHGSFCFLVCHKVYRIQLVTTPFEGQPIINVTPGCPGGSTCPPYPCAPGDPWDFIHFVYWENGSWWLYFEYSDAANEPVCYCVTWHESLPPNCAPHALAAFNEVTQTFDITNWNEGTCGSGYTREYFSFPPGGYVGEVMDNDCDVTEGVYHHKKIPAGAGSFMPGETFQLVAYINYDTLCPTRPPDYPSDWLIETVRVLPNGGLERVSVGNCQSAGGDHVPTSMAFGEAQCFVVCHKHYYVLLDTPLNATPMVSITPGCDPPCMSPYPCTPGNPGDYWYAIERWGNQYYLHFEYSNEQREPVCYCVHYNNLVMHSADVYSLASLRNPDYDVESFFDITYWTSSVQSEGVGTMEILAYPPGVYIGPYDPQFIARERKETREIAVGPGSLPPGTTGFFDVFVEVTIEGELQRKEIIESFIVTPQGRLERWDPVTPCTGLVPPMMDVGQSSCFLVCHQIYDIIMNAPPGAGEPIISVLTGCNEWPQCSFAPFCEPGAPTDYCYRFYRDPLGIWHMLFEYSNPMHEPVCYCVTYEGNLPDCETHELLALDERDQTLDISMCVVPRFPNPPAPCIANGHVTLWSDPPGALFIVHPGQLDFHDVGAEWYTIEVAVLPGELPPNVPITLYALIDYTDPPYPDVLKSETVRVEMNDPPQFEIADMGGECIYEDVPPYGMYAGDSYCFQVCHNVYHVPIFWPYLTTPQITITPGCYGPPIDQCMPVADCMPGGPFDYRWVLHPGDVTWELEFEYSNPNIEPVCFCVTVSQPPCNPVSDLVIDYGHPYAGDPPSVRLNWTCPQQAMYLIYTTTVPDTSGRPPHNLWTLDAALYLPPGPAEWHPFNTPNWWYRLYYIVADCTPPSKQTR